MADAALQSGDVVQLKVRGPVMTAGQIFVEESSGRTRVECYYVADGRVVQIAVDTAALELAYGDPPAAETAP